MSVSSSKAQLAFDVIERLTAWYEHCLKSEQAALHYLHSDRKFTSDTIAGFRLGYAPAKFDLECSDEELAMLSELGYVTLSDSGIHHNYEGRVMFPITDSIGRVRGFSGRRVGNGRTIKYYNSAETFFFKKSELLFGLEQSRRSIFLNNKAIVCEGFTDVLAFHQKGIRIAVACMGTSLTKQHMNHLYRYTDTLYFAFDADGSGKEALSKSVNLAKKYHMNYGVQKFPDGQDPAEYLLGSK